MLNKLRVALNEPPEPGYKRGSWDHILHAGQAIFDVVDSLSTKTARKRGGENIDFRKS